MTKQEEVQNKKLRGTNGEDIKKLNVKGEEEIKVKKKKEQKVSVSYTLKSFKNNNRKLAECETITPEQYATLEEIRTEATQKYINSEYGL